jgi:peptide/nickel transport system ATP-binding protein
LQLADAVATGENGNHSVLEVRHLTARLRQGNAIVPIVRNVSFDLYPGRTLALVGESGSGKTLTALSLLRIAFSPPALPPEGEVIYKKQNLLTLPEKQLRKIRGGKIGMVFQDPSSALDPVYPIGDQLTEASVLHLSLDEEQAFAKAVETLGAVGIPRPAMRMEDYPHQLSGGMKQRVMIAMALLCEPDILIADEPTTALDVTIQAQVLELIRDLQERFKMAVLLITHDMGIVAELAQDVAVMYAGGIVEQGDVHQIFHHPQHPYTMGLFESLNREGAKKCHLHTIKGSVPSFQHMPSGCAFHPRCPYAFEKCYSGEVPSFEIFPKPLHTARCWLREKKDE